LYSARETVKIAPSVARLYPTIVLNDTELLRMYQRGEYSPLTTDEAVAITKEMYRILDDAGINIIRVGLKSTDLITEGGEIRGHTFHPAFRQLVEGELAKEQLEEQLTELLQGSAESPEVHERFEFRSSGNSFSNMVGNSRRNKNYFAEKYPDLRIKYKVDHSLADGRYIVVKS
ncbi:MAG: radical SAM protein, partial [Clostridia bacterium]